MTDFDRNDKFQACTTTILKEDDLDEKSKESCEGCESTISGSLASTRAWRCSGSGSGTVCWRHNADINTWSNNDLGGGSGVAVVAIVATWRAVGSGKDWRVLLGGHARRMFTAVAVNAA